MNKPMTKSGFTEEELKEKYKDTYCPFCLNETDDIGDHWVGCEYEATLNGKYLQPQPLSRAEMLENKILVFASEAKKKNLSLKEINTTIKKMTDELREIRT